MNPLVHDRKGKSRARARGFTIAEVSLAVIVLAMGITTAITAMQRAFLALDTARNLEFAGAIMQCEMEKERLFTFAQASNAAYAPTIDATFLSSPAIAGRFTLSRAITVLSGHSGQMLQITLTARWRSYDGRSIARSYTTYYLQNGLNDYLYNNP